MPPKPIISAAKGQKSLFSFFNKTPQTAQTTQKTPDASHTTERESNEQNITGQTYRTEDHLANDSTTPVVTDTAPKKIDCSNKLKRLKRVKSALLHSDDEVWDDSKDEDIHKNPTMRHVKKNRKRGADEDEDFVNENEEGEEDDDDDDIVDSDEYESESEDDKPKSKKARAPNFSTTLESASKVHLTAFESTSKVKQVTPSNYNQTSPTLARAIFSPNSNFKANVTTASLVSDSSVEADPAEGPALTLPEGVVGLGSHEHNSWDWFKPVNRKDLEGRRMDHPEYNHRTLHVPTDFLRDQTPAMAQWWEFKRSNLDTVLFFKVGKFYELFHMDADVGMTELDLIYMKGPKAHSGFPEVSYGKFAASLVEKGYRVARIEQTETPDMLKERNESAGKGKRDKVVARELCSVMSKGTRTYCHLDDLTLLCSESTSTAEQSSLLVCITERASAVERHVDEIEDSAGTTRLEVPEYGICCVNTMLGNVTLAQFQDDSLRSRLRTMLSRFTPSEVLVEKNNISSETIGAVKLVSPSAVIELLRPGSGELPQTGEAVLKALAENQYFGATISRDEWPSIINAMIEGLRDGSSTLVMRALGGALWQLKRSLIDYEIVSMRRFYGYAPPDLEISVGCSTGADHDNEKPSADMSQIFRTQSSDYWDEHECSTDEESNSQNQNGYLSGVNATQVVAEHENSATTLNVTSDSNIVALEGPTSMTLDAIALSNLEILKNNFDHTEKGSLWSFVNRCKTQFGQRILKEWLCHPLYQPGHIKSRVHAVDELLASLLMQANDARTVLKNIPDLERLLLRVHSNGLKKKGVKAHPDSRAIMFEDQVYNSRKIKDFVDVLIGLESLLKIEAIFRSSKPASLLLQKIVKPKGHNSPGRFPSVEMSNLLRFFREIFDEKQAKANGFVKPKPGVDVEYDEALADITRCEEALVEHLRDMKRKTGLNDLKYWGSNKDRYQIEVEIGKASAVPSSWMARSQKKTHRRYRTQYIEERLAELTDAEDRIEQAQKDTLRKIFEKFDEHRQVWSDVVRCAGTLDALLSIAVVSSSPGYAWPNILSPSENAMPVLHIEGGRHPMLEFAFSQRGEGSYIPNTLTLGGTRSDYNSSNDSTASTALTSLTQSSTAQPPTISEPLPRLLLLSGPNMGGKSTLLRQTCLIAIMAQTGFKVPADSCTLTPVDRIFTRVGASDKILSGQSTFFVELAETATILKSATKNSLCILDELGRGTATFDGTAIAHAVVEHLVSDAQCRALFATHYHNLIDEWEMDPRVSLGHMDCFVQTLTDSNHETGRNFVASDTAQNSKTASVDSSAEVVTFLFRLCAGSSPKSYGINVARLAGLPREVINSAMSQSHLLEQRLIVQTRSEQEERDMKRWVTIQAYFEKLVSIVGSKCPAEEMISYARELWKRFQLQS